MQPTGLCQASSKGRTYLVPLGPVTITVIGRSSGTSSEASEP